MNKLKPLLAFAWRVAIALIILNVILGALAHFVAPLAFLKAAIYDPFAVVKNFLPGSASAPAATNP